MELLQKLGSRMGKAIERLTPIGYRMERMFRQGVRRAMRRPRGVAESPNLLPLLIQVLACFSKADGDVIEEEIDSSLGFLRYDYPEAVYSELRKLFRQALQEQQDLAAMATKLASQLTPERKIMLGVQLYDLIARAGLKQEQVIAFYSFMSQLGMAEQAIDIVYQLNASEESDPEIYQKGISPLESLTFGSNGSSDVLMKEFHGDERLLAYRYHDLILLKNRSNQAVTVRGRALPNGEFCRIYSGQRIIVGEQVLSYQELVNYFNAKKNLSSTIVFLVLNDDDDEVRLERAKTRESVLEVRFGLKVSVTALRNIDAVLNDVRLDQGVTVEASLEDKILFGTGSELNLTELRRRARAMGGRFQLLASKSEYLVSTNPNLLQEDDILLSPGTSGEVLLKISCDYDAKVGMLEVLQADRPILIGEFPVRNSAALADGDTIRIDTGQVLRCNFSERIIEEERNVISRLDVNDLTFRYTTGAAALDGISFSITRGEMVCIMGASGCGKSTLLRSLSCQLEPSRGEILLNNQSLYDNLEALKRYIYYIPQDDAFDECLTIEENLDLAAAIRAPHLSRRDRNRRIESKLVELGLSERRDSIVGSPVKKILSGGERKRLNIGLDMIGSADVYLFDEPTSGLSSKDSEHVIEIIRGMSHNKIVLVTIHQPSSKIFQMFNKAILLDKGGRLVFFGTPSEMLTYFAEAEHQQHFGTDMGACPACGTMRPEFIFDVLETPLRDLSGDIIYEENSRGQLVPARRYSPDYWRDKYEAHRLLQDVRQVSVAKESAPSILPVPGDKRDAFRWRDEWTQFSTLIKRVFVSKLRNRANLLTTMVAAPVLAAVIGAVLRYSESGKYDFASAYHIPTYLFLSLIVAMFLGLTNSSDDIIRDRVILQRERNLDVRLPYYIAAKALTLALFGLIQCVLFVLIGNFILSIRGMFWMYLAFMFMTSFSGIALGLLISSIVSDGKTASNLVPLVLIPQIIMGGALIKYEEMNQDLDLVYTIKRWLSEHPGVDGKQDEEHSKLRVPFICEFIPMRWSYEAIIVAQAKMNPFTRRQERIQKEIDELAGLRRGQPGGRRPNLSEAQEERLDTLKDLLATLSGLQAPKPNWIERRLDQIDYVLEGKPIDSMEWDTMEGTEGVTAEQLFLNQKVGDLVSKAVMEQADYRKNNQINVFFGPDKYYFNAHTSVYVLNSLVLNGFSALFLVLLYFSLKRQLRIVRRRV